MKSAAVKNENTSLPPTSKALPSDNAANARKVGPRKSKYDLNSVFDGDDGRTSRSTSDASDDKSQHMDESKEVPKHKLKTSAKNFLNDDSDED